MLNWRRISQENDALDTESHSKFSSNLSQNTSEGKEG